MGTALIYLLVVVAVAAAVFGLASAVFGRGEELAPAPPAPLPPACRSATSAAMTSARCGSSRPCGATGWPRSTGCSTGSPRSWTGRCGARRPAGPSRRGRRPSGRRWAAVTELARSPGRRRRGRRASEAARAECVRCSWAGSAPEYVAYHDDEWGRPLHGDVPLFERLSLEAFQSGLSWLVILRKRAAFRAAFAGFDPAAVAAFGAGRRRPAARRRRHRPQPRQDRGDDRTTPVGCSTLDRPLDELLWSFAPAAHAPPGHARRRARDLAGVGGHGEGAQATRVPLRRADHLLRADAGRRARRRPRGGLLAGRTRCVMPWSHWVKPIGRATALIAPVFLRSGAWGRMCGGSGRALSAVRRHRTDTLGTTRMGAADGGDEAPDR